MSKAAALAVGVLYGSSELEVAVCIAAAFVLCSGKERSAAGTPVISHQLCWRVALRLHSPSKFSSRCPLLFVSPCVSCCALCLLSYCPLPHLFFPLPCPPNPPQLNPPKQQQGEFVGKLADLVLKTYGASNAIAKSDIYFIQDKKKPQPYFDEDSDEGGDE